MKFRFCGDADCPDWVLAEINTLSRISSVKLKLLCQVVTNGIINPPIDMKKAEKLFTDSKLDSDIDLKACIACITFIIKSATRFQCASSALQSELQQLGLPQEHSTSIKRVTDDQINNLTKKFRKSTLKVNQLEDATAMLDSDTNCVDLELKIDGKISNVTLSRHTVNVLLEELKTARQKMAELIDH